VPVPKNCFPSQSCTCFQRLYSIDGAAACRHVASCVTMTACTLLSVSIVLCLSAIKGLHSLSHDLTVIHYLQGYGVDIIPILKFGSRTQQIMNSHSNPLPLRNGRALASRSGHVLLRRYLPSNLNWYTHVIGAKSVHTRARTSSLIVHNPLRVKQHNTFLEHRSSLTR